MANPKHLAILRDALKKDDIGIWNQWLKENRHVVPDLSRADLSGANLIFANLIDANLSEANLWSANLSRANLRSADLRSVNLRFADLRSVNLRSANLQDTDFTQATCGYTTFANVDLSQAKNLETVEHIRPSTIGIDTLERSGGNIPDVFLEGCGVSETIIAFAKSLVGQAIEFHSCFISYSSKDEEFAKYLHAQMKAEKLRVWFAPEDMKLGRKIHEQLYDAIQVHDRFLLILSEHSLKSNWVESEIRRARKREREEGRQILFPISLLSYEQLREWELFDADEGRDLAQEVREYLIGDFSKWKDHDSFQPLFQKLVEGLRRS